MQLAEEQTEVSLSGSGDRIDNVGMLCKVTPLLVRFALDHVRPLPKF